MKRKLKGLSENDKSEEFLSYIDFIRESAEKIDKLVIGFKSYVSAKESSDDFSRFHLSPLIEEVIIEKQKMLDSNYASISSGKMPVVFGKRDKLKEVIDHLIENAIIHKLADKRPVIQISASEREKDWLITVKDNGSGIEKKYQNKVFEVLEKVGVNEKPGSGLGLSICKSIIENHGGKIWVDSMPGYGSTFSFTLPK